MNLCRLSALALCVSFVAPSLLAFGQSNAAEVASSNEGVIVQLGLAGKWKLGHDLQVAITLPDELAKQVDRIEVESVDGDGVPVVYQQEAESTAKAAHQSIIVRIGREQAELRVKLLSGDTTLHEESLLLSGDRSGFPSDQVFVASIGGAMGLQELSGTESGRGRSSIAIAELHAASDVPSDWHALAGCDLLVIGCDDLPLLRSIDPHQWNAIDHWVRRGGACVITLGVSGDQLPETIQAWLPGLANEVVKINDPGAIEALVSTDVPLRTIEATRLDKATGDTILTLTDSLGRECPWWIREPRGHGLVQFVASSLRSDSFDQWNDRRALWQQLVRDSIDLQRDMERSTGNVGDASYLGYNDLVGQLRASLDVFPTIRVISFSQLAAVLIGILILVGPVDYFLSVKWLRKPHLSWYFSGFCLLLASIALATVYQAIRPQEIRVNTAQIIDIDTSNGRVGGHLWTHVYSGAAGLVDVSVNAGESVPVRIDWQGLPGRGLGGIESQLSADSGMPGYTIKREDNSTSIHGVGILAAGTKSFAATWSDQIDVPNESNLVEAGGVNQLTGRVVNPLPVELIEPALFYNNWSYGLGSRIPANGVVTVSYESIPKDITRRLNRRRVIDNSDLSTPWDPSDRQSLDRLLELMMFYDAASGAAYTSLRHRYHHTLDQSELMKTNLAVLIGRVEEPFATTVVRASDDGRPVEQDVETTWCRILIPVKPADK